MNCKTERTKGRWKVKKWMFRVCMLKKRRNDTIRQQIIYMPNMAKEREKREYLTNGYGNAAHIFSRMFYNSSTLTREKERERGGRTPFRHLQHICFPRASFRTRSWFVRWNIECGTDLMTKMIKELHKFDRCNKQLQRSWKTLSAAIWEHWGFTNHAFPSLHKNTSEIVFNLFPSVSVPEVLRSIKEWDRWHTFELHEIYDDKQWEFGNK